MIKILYANGCSMTEGSELGNIKFGWDEAKYGTGTARHYYHISDEHKAYMEKYSWPTVLQQKMDIENIFNNAWGGGSNARILRTTICDVNKLLQTYKANEIFVAIGWTNFGRFELRHRDKWVQFIPNMIQDIKKSDSSLAPDFVKLLNKYCLWISTDINYSVSSFLIELTALKNFLENKGIKFIFTQSLSGGVHSTFNNDQRNALLKNEELIDLTNSIGLNDKSVIFSKTRCDLNSLIFPNKNDSITFYDFCTHHPAGPVPRGNGFHPLELGHELWADYLHEQVTLRGIL